MTNEPATKMYNTAKSPQKNDPFKSQFEAFKKNSLVDLNHPHRRKSPAFKTATFEEF